MDFSVMTLNLRYNNPGDGDNAWPHRYEQVVALLRRYDPLVIGTQEGLHDMLLSLGEGLPEYGWIGEGRYGGHDDEHNAIFYKKTELGLAGQGQFWLSEHPDRPGSVSWESSLPRICVWAHLKSASDPRMQMKVFNTHLDHRSKRAQEEGIKLVLRTMREHYRREPMPMIVMGDLNSVPDDAAVRLLREHAAAPAGGLRLIDCFSALPGRPGRTFHGFQGGEEGEPIDYIFATPDIRQKETVVIRDSANGRFPSDHYPVLARIGLYAE
ncbi:hypothetical protein SD70_07505 [Gordoniibacillus kamchatkensis]|uniref:Endonuclease/exonuclease/phosphatase domain-containing protein n=1 Tax=Gordoniibacillus kamchatkensis TaxID=1590651 RepID=A0ABR5AJV7_9BACL|nr:endonuclease/exonuclease/phosphatase family protein [Paenibacillus sp. VKM B-2647]KIL41299.1 hypothetical protein SD70_07505 [Paenibacillus sp. VKM B-2647]